MLVVRNLIVGALWTIVICGTLIGWTTLFVAFALKPDTTISVQTFGAEVANACGWWAFLTPPVISGLAYWKEFLPGFMKAKDSPALN